MAITFVNNGDWSPGSTSITPGIPASMQAGDLMLLVVHTCNQPVSAITGWTQVTGSPISTGTVNTAGGTRVAVYYRWWQSGDAAPNVTIPGGTVSNGMIFGYRGVDPTTPFDATPTSNIVTPAETTLTMQGITTATANAWIVHCVARDQDLNNSAAVASPVNANLTGMTERCDKVVNTGVGGGIYVQDGVKASAGATGNTTATQTSSIACNLTIALRVNVVNHATTGALTAQGSTVVGSAQHKVLHPTSGALIGQGSTVAGASSRTRQHSSSGTLTGQGSQIVGAADRQKPPAFVTHVTSGALIGQGATLTGSAARTRHHTGSGTLTGQGSTITGASARFRAHTSSGVLAGQGSTLVGSANRLRSHQSSGALVGAGAAVTGAATRTGTATTHDTSGALTAQGAAMVGSSAIGAALFSFAHGTISSSRRMVHGPQLVTYADDKPDDDIQPEEPVQEHQPTPTGLGDILKQSHPVIRDSEKRANDKDSHSTPKPVKNSKREPSARAIKRAQLLEEEERQIMELLFEFMD